MAATAPPPDRNRLWIGVSAAAAAAAGLFAFLMYRGYAAAADEFETTRKGFGDVRKYRKDFDVIAQQQAQGVVVIPEDQDKIPGILERDLKRQSLGYQKIFPQRHPPRDGWVMHSFQIELDDKAGPIPRQNLALFLREVERVRPWLKSRDLNIQKFDETGQILKAAVTFAYFVPEDKAPSQ